jgi:hypothetical protein
MLHLSSMARVLWILLASMILAAHLEAGVVEPRHEVGASEMKVEGKIIDIGTDLIVVNTPTVNYTVNKATAPLGAKIGDKVTLWVTSNHVVIDHHREATGRRHRTMTGTLLDAESKKQIKLWTPEGNKVYSLDEHEAKTKALPEGTMVSVEINEADKVIDLHPVETEAAACDKRHHCKVMLHGIVRKVGDGLIFIKTPVIEYELTANFAPRNTAPGDEMTLWAHENDVVLDHYRAGDMSHRRFVTGPLRYADTTRAHIKLWTPEGEKTFRLPQIKTAGHLREGHPVTLEVSGVDEVVDLWQSS